MWKNWSMQLLIVWVKQKGTSGMAILVNELEHIYNKGTAYEKKALHHVTLQIKDREMIGLIGHTGSGKINPYHASQRSFKTDRRRCIL